VLSLEQSYNQPINPLIVSNRIIFAGDRSGKDQAPEDPREWPQKIVVDGVTKYERPSHGAAVLSAAGSINFGVVNQAVMVPVKISNGIEDNNIPEGFSDYGTTPQAVHQAFLMALGDIASRGASFEQSIFSISLCKSTSVLLQDQWIRISTLTCW
jgi:hypothetical protein